MGGCAYTGIHAWVRRNWGKANRCEICNKKNLLSRQVHWANKDHKYSRNKDDWMMVCRQCHAEYDMKYNNITFRNKRSLITHCPKGHEYNEENTAIYNGSRVCKTCARERARIRRGNR